MSSTPSSVVAVGGDPSPSGEFRAVDFAAVARVLARVVRGMGLSVPGFRCPPRRVGADRTIRRRASATVVAVRVKRRPVPAVVADMIEGVVVANQLVTPESDRARAALWEAVIAEGWLEAVGPVSVPATSPPQPPPVAPLPAGSIDVDLQPVPSAA